MSEDHFDQWEHYNFEEKHVISRNSGKMFKKDINHNYFPTQCKICMSLQQLKIYYNWSE